MPFRLFFANVLVITLTISPVLAASEIDAIALSEVAHIHGIGFDPTSPERILLATHFGIYRTNPDGTASQVSRFENDFMGFSPASDGSGKLYASGHPVTGGNMGIIVSDDGGVSWTVSDGVGGPVDFHAMTVSKADPETLYGIFRGVQVSQDGGQSWSVAAAAPEGIIDLAAAADTPDHLYAATANGLLESTDAGRNWVATGPLNGAATMVETAGDGSTYVFMAGDGLYRREDKDGPWRLISDGFGASEILHLAVDPSNQTRIVASTQASQVIVSLDRGVTWSAFAR